MHTKGSNVANHAWSKNHQIDFDNALIIDKAYYRHLKTLESWHTAKTVDADNQGGKRLGDETSASEQKGVMQWTGIKLDARSKWLLPWVSSIILVIYEVPEKCRLWFIFSLTYPP